MKKLLLLLSIAFLGQIHGQIITTIAGNGTAGFSGDGGQATAAELNFPTNLTFDALGNLYFSDQQNNRIRKINSTGVITTFAGYTTTNGFSGDGGPATLAQFHNPCGIRFDKMGNLYIADAYNYRVRMINTSGVISTVAGIGTAGYSGDGGLATAAELASINDIAFDTSGNLYIEDYGNYRIRKVDTAGIISTVAGNGISGFSGDGGLAINAQISATEAIAFDASGNLYIVDWGNQRIRMVNNSGIITTVVGNGVAGYSGDGGQAINAELNRPTGITFDSAGNMYISDINNYRIRKVATNGIISTIAGNGNPGVTGDGGPAISAELYYPLGLGFDVSGNLYIASGTCNLIRKVTNAGQIGLKEFSNKNTELNFYPNPTSDQFFIDANTTDKLTVDLYSVNGSHVFSKSVSDKENISVAILDNGIYTLTIKTTDRSVNKKLVIVR